MWRRLTDKDAEEDKSHNPRVFLEGMDDGEAEDGDNIRDDRDDDAANADCQSVVGNRAEELTTDNHVDDCEATANDNVEDRCKLGAPEAKGVSGRRNRSQSKL